MHSFDLHLNIDFDIDIGGIEICVVESNTDGVAVDAGFKQLACASVTTKSPKTKSIQGALSVIDSCRSKRSHDCTKYYAKQRMECTLHSPFSGYCYYQAAGCLISGFFAGNM